MPGRILNLRTLALRASALLGCLAVALATLPQPADAQDDGGRMEPDRACPTEAEPAGFGDYNAIPPVHAYNVDCAVASGIVRGFADGTYGPRLPVRRDQMAAFIALTLAAAGVELPDGQADTFTDVGAGNTHAEHINRLAAVGIVQGGPSGLAPDQYGPGLQTRRDQMASFLMRAAGYALHGDVDHFDDAAQRFTDVTAANPHFAKVNAAAANLVAGGVGDGRYAPAQVTRRDQLATFVTSLLVFVVAEQRHGGHEAADHQVNSPPPVREARAWTNSPNLINARAHPNHPDRVIYAFDVEVKNPVRENFSVFDDKLDADGRRGVRRHPTKVWLNKTRTRVLAHFPSGVVADARRATIRHGAVHDDRNRSAYAAGRSLNGHERTARPDLVAVRATINAKGNTVVRYAFDQHVSERDRYAQLYPDELFLVDADNNITQSLDHLQGACRSAYEDRYTNVPYEETIRVVNCYSPAVVQAAVVGSTQAMPPHGGWFPPDYQEVNTDGITPSHTEGAAPIPGR